MRIDRILDRFLEHKSHELTEEEFTLIWRRLEATFLNLNDNEFKLLLSNLKEFIQLLGFEISLSRLSGSDV